MTHEREKLPTRRCGEIIRFAFPPRSWQFYVVHYSCFADGRPAELFVSMSGKAAVGSALEAMARDSAILASIALQFGVPLATLIEATTAETNGTATSVIGCALRLVRDALGGDDPEIPVPAIPPAGTGAGGEGIVATAALATDLACGASA